MSAADASPGFMCNLKRWQEIAEGIIAFQFEKPTGWTFKPGQYLDMMLLEPSETDSEGNLSITCGPHEVTLMVTTRMWETRRSSDPNRKL